VKNLQLIETLLDDKKLYYNETDLFFLIFKCQTYSEKR